MSRVKRKQSGFTLIEILAVVFLASLMAVASVVVFSAGGPQKELQNQVEQFIEYANQVHDLSILTGEPVGLVLTPPAWADSSLDVEGWTYNWRRFVDVPVAQAASAQSNLSQQNTSQQQSLANIPQLQNSSVGTWMDIDGVSAIEISPDVQLYVLLDGHDWDWQATPKSDQPIFILYPTGEAEPFQFKLEFIYKDPNIAPQHVELDESGKLQWVQARDELQRLQEGFN